LVEGKLPGEFRLVPQVKAHSRMDIKIAFRCLLAQSPDSPHYVSTQLSDSSAIKRCKFGHVNAAFVLDVTLGAA
jgi:hypothetical protein